MMQCKDIPDRPILLFLQALDGRWAHWLGDEYESSVTHAFPAEAKGTKLVLAKMRQLMRRGLVDGCPCGCRGDFEITEKGRSLLSAQDKKEEGEA